MMAHKSIIWIVVLLAVSIFAVIATAGSRITAGDTLAGEIEGIQSRFIACCYGIRLEVVSVTETGDIQGTAHLTPRDGGDVRSVPFTGKVNDSGMTFIPEGAFKFPSTGNLQWNGTSLVGKYTIDTSKPGLQLTGQIKLAPLVQKSEGQR